MEGQAKRITRSVQVGHIPMGGGAPISVQSMCTTDTRDWKATLLQIKQLEEAGCDIVRVAVPDAEAAQALSMICQQSPIPVVADIHFDYRLAIAAIRAGVHKIRINPNNMRDDDGLKKTAEAARQRCIPIRVGVNSGSLTRELIDHHGGVTAEAMVESALSACADLEREGFRDIVLSAKASCPVLMIETYRKLAKACDYPLHLGVTEAGTREEGIIRSAVGLGALLSEGIGDTIRVSLTADPVHEVQAAYSILKALSLRQRGATLVSCPTCGRTEVPLIAIAEEVEKRLKDIKAPIRVAVMGCVVNGPGEAREADVGIAGGKDSFVLFRKGEVLRKVRADHAVAALMDEVDRWIKEMEQADA